jgi:hypothetical protein
MSSAPAALLGQSNSGVELLSGLDPAGGRRSASSARPPLPARGTLTRPASPDAAQNDGTNASGRAQPSLSHAAAADSEGPVAGDVDAQAISLEVTDAHITLLLNAGLLARHPQEAHAYLFSVPTTGPLVKSIAKGRVEVTFTSR